MNTDLCSQINSELLGLAPDSQQRVLEFLRTLKSSGKGTSGASLKSTASKISSSDAKTMIDAIENGGEQVEPNDW